MAEKPASNKLGDTIAIIVGAPFTLFILLLWSPYLLLGAIVGFFSSDEPVKLSGAKTSPGTSPSANRTSVEPLSKGTFLLIAASLFAALVGLLSLKSGGGSSGLSFRGASHSAPAGSPSGFSGASYRNSPSSGSQGGPVWVNGYYRRDGTYVQPHYRTAPDGNISNNWSTSPNVNPYTGKTGTHSQFPSPTRTYRR